MFDFLKYIQPASYYRLIHQMPEAILINSFESRDVCKYYKQPNSALLDTLYYSLQTGEIPIVNQVRSNLQNIIITDTFDNYIFIRRYFSLIQVFYVFILRVLSLHNPLKEIYGFVFALFKLKRVKISPAEFEDWKEYQSQLLKSNPLVTVVIPTLNRYKYLKDVLADLEKQEYKNFEVIVVDQSEPVDLEFYKGWTLNIRLIQQKEKALWLARNTAIKQSKGEYVLLFDDDSRVESDWISNHIKCLDFFSAMVSAGVTNTLVGGGLGKKESYFHLSDVFDTGNALVHRSVFEKVGLFDRQFDKQRMGDSEFGLRSLLGGKKLISNPYASRVHLKVETGGLRQMGSWDALRPKSLFAPRPVPSVLYLIRKYFGSQEAIFYIVKNIPQSYMPYRFKRSKVVKLLYLFLFPVFIPLAFIAIIRSWKLATLKLNQGSLIENLI